MSPIEGVLIAFSMVFGIFYFSVRLLFLGIVFSIEDEKYPIIRSLKLSKGNFWKIAILIAIFFSMLSTILGVVITLFGAIFANFEINKYFSIPFIPIVTVTEMYMMTIILNFYKKIKDEKNNLLEI
jgi:nitrogen fixation/metabolism regulation signal transduction histidine kinase